jgi:putative hydrolase of HD superfamily
MTMSSEDAQAAAESAARFIYMAGQMKELERGGWIQARVPRPESVADHSWRVAVIALMIAEQEGADPHRAAVLGLFHDLPECYYGDVTSVGKPYVETADPGRVIEDQTRGLAGSLAALIAGAVAEHESAKTPDASSEAICSRDADKIDCWFQGRLYAAAGNTLVRPIVDSMPGMITTATGLSMIKAAEKMSPGAWWYDFAAAYGADARD